MHIGFEVVEEHSTLEAHSSEGEDSQEKGVGEGVVGEGEGELGPERHCSLRTDALGCN